ncbi:MAG TPA: PilZ domain-containing protein [Thermoanaerobaculia bacterium]|nr:PilZ domain-containing protein [Thermoanaerobaculia bacterium]
MVERREFQRLKLAKPILGTLDAHSALILDIGIGGAFIEHRGRANAGLRFRVAFRWQGAEIAFDATVVRSSVVREGGEEGVVSHSAVNFIKSHGDSEARLQEMMGTFVAQLLAAHRANASAEGKGAGILGQLGQARRARSHGLVSHRWDGKVWTSAPTINAKQPADGFTVAAYEDDEELATLREAYETADEEGRKLIRLVAELSARSAAK